jgi:FkbM family methyltransferase
LTTRGFSAMGKKGHAAGPSVFMPWAGVWYEVAEGMLMTDAPHEGDSLGWLPASPWDSMPAGIMVRLRLLAWKLGIRLPKFKAGYERGYRAHVLDFTAKHADSLDGMMERLKSGLDTESIAAIDEFYANCGTISRMERVREHEWRGPLPGGLDVPAAIRGLKAVNREYRRPRGTDHMMSIHDFIFHNGLVFVPEKTRRMLTEGRDILDCGAFNGGSAAMFRRFYRPRRIYSFEPDRDNFRMLTETVRLNGLDNVAPVRLGVSRQKGTAPFRRAGFGSRICGEGGGNRDRIETTDIDSFVRENGVEPGVIKMDIEGAEAEALEGAWETIGKFRPVLLISIYHRLDDFFGIKPRAEEKLPGYRFLVRRTTLYHPIYETMLIAYPQNRGRQASGCRRAMVYK